MFRHGHHTTAWFEAAVNELWRPGMSVEDLNRAVMKRAPVRHPLPEAGNHQPLDHIEGRLNLDRGLAPTGHALSIILDACATTVERKSM